MNPVNLSPENLEEARADWRLMVVRHLILACLTAPTNEEMQPHWESGQTPLQAAWEISHNRDPQGECA